MALDLVYPLSALTLAAVAATNMRALPYAAVMVVLALIWNAFQRSMSRWLEFFLTQFRDAQVAKNSKARCLPKFRTSREGCHLS